MDSSFCEGCHLIPFIFLRFAILSPSPWQDLKYTLFILTKLVLFSLSIWKSMLQLSPWQDLFCCLMLPRSIPCILIGSVVLSPACWQCLSSFSLHSGKILHLTFFTLSESVLLSLSVWKCLSSCHFHPNKIGFVTSCWQGLSSYPPHTDWVCHLKPCILTGSVILFPSVWSGSFHPCFHQCE